LGCVSGKKVSSQQSAVGSWQKKFTNTFYLNFSFILYLCQVNKSLMQLKYPVYQPSLKGNEKKYVVDCLESTWISSKGKYIGLFEEKFAGFTGIPHTTTVCNGTVALHLALLALDIKPGDEIITPTLTYIATANAIRYVGAIPVFVDSLKDTWQMDPRDVKRKITKKTKAVIAVHLYGHPCDMDTLLHICREKNLFLVEDCAEAIGSKYKDKHTGSFGDISTFSFFGNKTITTGEGGMVVSPHFELIEKVRHLKNQGVSPKPYWHDVIGYNYRMTNVTAAIGLAQLERINEILIAKIKIAERYAKIFEGTGIEFHKPHPDVFHSYWMVSVLIPDGTRRDTIRDMMLLHGVDTRPVFYPVHQMPMYESPKPAHFPVAGDLAARGITLPSYPELNPKDILYIAFSLLNAIDS
jgi:perosamine synthetase